MQTGLRNRVAILAGASQGIGRATAYALAEEGAHVALCSRNAEALEKVADDLRQRFNVKTYVGAVDVRDSSAIHQFVASVHSTFDRVDVCFINGGGPPAKQFLETSDADWDDAFALNLRSAVVFARAVAPHMQRQRWGRIITLTSITVRQPQPNLVLSNAIRAGVLGLVRSLANELGKDGITVNNVGPGYTATDRLKQLAAHRAAASGQSE